LIVSRKEVGTVGVAWRDSHEVLARLLREHGQDPDRVTNVEAAWQAFQSFLAHPVDGLEAGPDSDADGFIVQWGRYGQKDGRPSLTFTRQFAVDVRATWAEPDWYQPDHWQVNLELAFDDAPALADLGELAVADTGFDFRPPGPEQDEAFRDVEWEIHQYPALRALWASTPAVSGITVYQAD
jgi:hypothetical protein